MLEVDLSIPTILDPITPVFELLVPLLQSLDFHYFRPLGTQHNRSGVHPLVCVYPDFPLSLAVPLQEPFSQATFSTRSPIPPLGGRHRRDSASLQMKGILFLLFPNPES